MNMPISNEVFIKSKSHGFEVDQSEIRFYPSVVVVYGGLVLALIFSFLVYIWKITSQGEGQIIANTLLLISLILIIILLRTVFNKKPSLTLNEEGMFSKRTGKLLWQNISGFNLREASTGEDSVTLLDVILTDGKKVTPVTSFLSMTPPKLMRVMETYHAHGHEAAVNLLRDLL